MSQKSHQTCGCCGWSKVTTYQGLRTHQGKMGCTPKGLSVPQSLQYTPSYPSYSKPAVSYAPPPAYSDYESPKPVYQSPNSSSGTKQTVEESCLQTCHCGWSKVTSYQGLRIHQGRMGCTPKGLGIPANLQHLFGSSTQRNEVAPPKPAEIRPSLRSAGSIDKKPIKWEKISISRQPPSRSTPVTTETKPFYETPQQYRQSATEGYKTRRALDFSTSEQQKTASKQYQSNRKDRIKSSIQLQIASREQKLNKIRSSAKACKLSLEAEWKEINNVFLEVIEIVQKARERALRPLENRREKLKCEAQSVIKKLMEDIQKLEKSMDEVDYAADLDDDLFKNLKSKDYSINTAVSFGTFQTTIAATMEQIQQELDKLSVIELTRTASFAVDVKLDHNTGHQWLKKIQDGGRSQQIPWAPTGFTSGRSYWEVEVGTKSSWYLGLASARTKMMRRPKLNPKNGFWVIAQDEGGEYSSLTAPPVCLEMKAKPQKVGVFVDYEEGLVSFYNVTAQTHIHSFTKCRFHDKIFPYYFISTVTN